MKRDLTSGSISGNIWHLSIPMIAANLLQNAFSFVDMIFVGMLGPEAIAAVAMGGLILGMVFTIAIGISMGTVALVARYTGAKQLDAVENVVIQSLLLGVMGSFFTAAVGYFFAGDILKLLGASPEVVSQGIPYIQVMFIGSFTMFFSVSLGAALRGAGDAMTPTIILAGSTVLNIALDPLLIFGVWGFPRLEIAGSALATVIARGCGVIFLFWVCSSGKGFFTLHLRNPKFDWATMKIILKIGVFGSLQATLRNLSGVVLMRIVALYGTFTVAAYGVGMRLQMMVMMPGFGIGNAVATLVGQNLGAGKAERAERTANTAMLSGFGIMTALGIVNILFASPLIRLFNANPEVVRLGTLYLYATAGVAGFIGISIILGRGFNGAGDTLSPMVITGIALFLLRIPLALGGAALWDVLGLFVGIATSTVFQGLVMIFWFRKGRWKDKQVG